MTKRPNFTNYRMASSPVEGVMHPAARATPPPPISDPTSKDLCVIIIGTLSEGVSGVIGPFRSAEAAHEYADSDHDLQDREWHIADLIPPAPESDDDLITLAELEPEKEADDE